MQETLRGTVLNTMPRRVSCIPQLLFAWQR